MVFPKSIKWQLIASTTSLIILFCISSSVSLNILDQIGTVNRSLVFKSLPAVQASSQLAHLAHEMVILGYEFERTEDLELLKRSYTKFNKLQDSMSMLISEVFVGDSEIDILFIHSSNQQIRNLTSIIFQLKSRRLSQNETVTNELAKDSLVKLHDLSNGLASVTTDYAEKVISATSTIALEVDATYIQGRNSIIVMLLIIGIPILLIFWFYVVRRISNRLTLLSNAITQQETVLPNTRISISGQDEIAAMARSAESLLENRLELLHEQGILEELVSDRTKKLQEEINERKQTEKKFRNLVEGSLQGIFVHDDFKPLFANQQCADIFGYANPEEILALDSILSAFWIPEEQERMRGYNVGRLEEEVPDYFEIQGRRADGGTFWLGSHISTIDWLGKKAIMGAVIDITDRKLTEQAMRRSQKMEAVGHITGGIAHDFNNLLGVIIGNLSLLKDQAKSYEKLLKRITTIDGAVHRAAELVNQLLGFSRHQATDVVMANINQIILDMSDLIERSITPEIGVVQELSEELWLTEINVGDFQDTLLNLILNARDAIPGSGQLAIETRNCQLDTAYCFHHPDTTPGAYVQLVVSDNGVGISAEQQDRIFDPFYTTKEIGKGTGLGLSMVFGFVTRSHGYINVNSELGVGTTLSIYLPRAVEQVKPEKIIDQEPAVLPSGNETILVVDDEVELLAVAQELLEMQGYQVFTATNGKQALELLAGEDRIALLFSDVIMPGGMNGYELAEQATAQQPDLKVLLTSGYTKKAVVHNGQARFESNLLSKPYTQSELVRRVRETMDNLNRECIGPE